MSTRPSTKQIDHEGAPLDQVLSGINASETTQASIVAALGYLPTGPVSPTFTGTPTAPTASLGTNSQQLATTAFVQTAVAGGSAGVTSVNGRSGAVALVSGDVTGALGYTPATIVSPALSGVPTAPTATVGTDTTQLATTAFVKAAVTANTAGVASFNGRTGAVSLTAADTIKSLTSTAVTKDVIWNAAIPGAVNAGDTTSIYLQRNADYTGGSFGQVRSALYLETFTPTGTHGPFEWGLTSVINSRSIVSGGGEGASPQNVGINGTAFRTAGNAPVWAGNFAAYHMAAEYTSADGPMHGLEVNVGGNGTDASESTIGVYVTPQLRSDVTGPGVFDAWTGLLINGGAGSLARFRNGITNQAGSVFGYLDRGSHQVAIDLSSSTNVVAALRIKANDFIDFDATSQKRMKFNPSTGYLEFYSGGQRRGYINLASGADVDLAASGGGGGSGVTLDTEQTITGYKIFTGGARFNAAILDGYIAFGSAGSIQWSSAMTSISAGSGFATLPTNPVGFVKILIDGAERKIPYYV